MSKRTDLIGTGKNCLVRDEPQFSDKARQTVVKGRTLTRQAGKKAVDALRSKSENERGTRKKPHNKTKPKSGQTAKLPKTKSAAKSKRAAQKTALKGNGYGKKTKS